MGLVARYIDAISDEQRDRVIEAKDISDGPFFFNDQPDGTYCGCLVGVAEMEHARMEAPIDRGMYTGSWYPSDFFPRLCRRFGKARIVAACKARAAKGNAPTVTEIRAKVYRELVPVGGMNGRYPEDLR